MVLGLAGYLLWNWTPFNQDQKNYIDKYKGLAIREMERTGIPASIKMAQALLESNSGKSELARRGNNHFGIKCHSKWTGATLYKKDDDIENGRLVESCFRSYPSVEGSYRDHSDFLRNGQRYQFLFDLDPQNYEAWARGLKKAGYATSRYYHKNLIDLIETHRLYELDKMSSEDVPLPVDSTFASNPLTPGGIFLTINDVKYVTAREGETLEDISARVKYSTTRLLRYNEGIPQADFALSAGDVVFIQPKRRHWRGRQKYHTVTEGETMYLIAQRYGIDYGRLYRRNRMIRGEEPEEGERIKIRGGKVSKAPKLSADPTGPGMGEELPFEIEGPSQRSGSNPLFGPETNPAVPASSPSTPAVPVTPPAANPKAAPPPALEPTRQAPPTQPIYHTVAYGETLWRISQKYETTVNEIKRLNDMLGNDVSPGQVIRVQ